MSPSRLSRFLQQLPDKTEGSREIPLTEIHTSLHQPRRFFAEAKLQQLAASIREHGILESLILRPRPEGDYELVAGERRLRAAKIVGLESVPAIVRELDDNEARQLALVENLQREDLNPYEETEAAASLICLELNYSLDDLRSLLNQAENANRGKATLTGTGTRNLEIVSALLEKLGLGTTESFRSNRLRLLSYPDDLKEVLRAGKLEYSKAKVIAAVKDDKQRADLLNWALDTGATRPQIQQRIKASKPKPEKTETLRQEYADIGKKLDGLEGDRLKQARKLLKQLRKLVEG